MVEFPSYGDLMVSRTIRQIATLATAATLLSAPAVAQSPNAPAVNGPAKGAGATTQATGQPAVAPQLGAPPGAGGTQPSPPPGATQARPATTVEQPSTACCPGSSSNEAWTAKDYATLVSGLAGILAFFVGIGAIWSNLRSTRSNNNQKTNEAELKSIEEKLDKFYGPYTQLSNTNKLIADELKSRHGDVPDMRLLLLMLDPGWRDKLSRGDKTLVDEIVDIDRKLLAFIQESSGMVDQALQPYLYRAAAHFRMMLRAHEGALDNLPTRYGAYVYPRQLDATMNLEVERLKNRMSLLRLEPTKLQPPLQALAIPAELALPPWPGRPAQARPATS